MQEQYDNILQERIHEKPIKAVTVDGKTVQSTFNPLTIGSRYNPKCIPSRYNEAKVVNPDSKDCDA
jgi:hypothetical protein